MLIEIWIAGTFAFSVEAKAHVEAPNTPEEYLQVDSADFTRIKISDSQFYKSVDFVLDSLEAAAAATEKSAPDTCVNLPLPLYDQTLDEINSPIVEDQTINSPDVDSDER